jgi:hypothetical protein
MIDIAILRILLLVNLRISNYDIGKFSLLRKFLKKHPNQANSVEQNPNGILGWIYVLRQMKDHDLKEICGTDVALYIVFLRLSAKFFAWLTVFNCAVLIPLYVTGYPATE